MTLTNTYTASGARVHIHFGSKTTTNLWGPWVIVNDMTLLAELKVCLTESDYLAVRNKYASNFTTLTTPYIRTSKYIGPPVPRPSRLRIQGFQ